MEQNKSTQIIQNYSNKYREGGKSEIVIPLEGDNQESIALAHNPVFY